MEIYRIFIAMFLTFCCSFAEVLGRTNLTAGQCFKAQTQKFVSSSEILWILIFRTLFWNELVWVFPALLSGCVELYVLVNNTDTLEGGEINNQRFGSKGQGTSLPPAIAIYHGEQGGVAHPWSLLGWWPVGGGNNGVAISWPKVLSSLNHGLLLSVLRTFFKGSEVKKTSTHTHEQNFQKKSFLFFFCSSFLRQFTASCVTLTYPCYGYFPVPSDCTKFIQCSLYHIFQCTCDVGTRCGSQNLPFFVKNIEKDFFPPLECCFEFGRIFRQKGRHRIRFWRHWSKSQRDIFFQVWQSVGPVCAWRGCRLFVRCCFHATSRRNG